MGNGYTIPRRSLTISIVGDVAIGKTNLLEAARNRVYRKYRSKPLNDDKEWLIDLPDVTLHVNDETDSNSNSTYPFDSCDACILAFSLADRQSFENLRKKWIPLIQDSRSHTNQDLQIIIVGLKLDLRQSYLVEKKKKSTAVDVGVFVADSLKIPSADAFFCASNLPPEFLLRIFRNLNSFQLCTAARVCKQWHSVGNSIYLWKNRQRGAPISTQEGSRLCVEMEARKYLECSAVEMKGVKQVFQEAVQAALDASSARLAYGAKAQKKDARKSKAVAATQQHQQQQQQQQAAAQDKGKAPVDKP